MDVEVLNIGIDIGIGCLFIVSKYAILGILVLAISESG